MGRRGRLCVSRTPPPFAASLRRRHPSSRSVTVRRSIATNVRPEDRRRIHKRPMRTGLFDAQLCSEDNLGNISKMVKEMFRVLKPGGVYLLVSHGLPVTRLGYLSGASLHWHVEYQQSRECSRFASRTAVAHPTRKMKRLSLRRDHPCRRRRVRVIAPDGSQPNRRSRMPNKRRARRARPTATFCTFVERPHKTDGPLTVSNVHFAAAAVLLRYCVRARAPVRTHAFARTLNGPSLGRSLLS